MNVTLPINLVFPILKLFQEVNEELNDLTRRMNQLVEVQQVKDQVNENFQEYQDKMKEIFDRKAKEISFLLGDFILRWDARREDPSKHGKFDPLWFGPFKIATIEGFNSFSLQNLDGEILRSPVNGRYLRHFSQ
jgi:hypothetical protein